MLDEREKKTKNNTPWCHKSKQKKRDYN